MLCRKCGNEFPKKVKIDGKIKKLRNRKYCLQCSPFDCHNTSKLENKDKIKQCCDCGKTIVRKNERGVRCWNCANRKARTEKLAKVKSIVGISCWCCGYDRCWRALEFHHVISENKLFGITINELQFKWERIYQELRKCVLLCCICHREYHAGLIEAQKIYQLWLDRWDEIDKMALTTRGF